MRFLREHGAAAEARWAEADVRGAEADVRREQWRAKPVRLTADFNQNQIAIQSACKAIDERLTALTVVVARNRRKN